MLVQAAILFWKELIDERSLMPFEISLQESSSSYVKRKFSHTPIFVLFYIISGWVSLHCPTPYSNIFSCIVYTECIKKKVIEL